MGMSLDIAYILYFNIYILFLFSRFRKYYKSLFLGLVDMAIVNGYILHSLVRKRKGLKEKTHFEYIQELQESLVQFKEVQFTEDVAAISRRPINVARAMHTSTDHVLLQVHAFREHNGVKRLMQRACKVCSIYKVI